jgi:glutamine amidotransferase
MGWNTLEIGRKSDLLKNIENGIWVYFVHSYYPKINDDTAVIATTDYGIKIPAVIAKDNIYGTQFHPEKSGPAGITMLNNFISICNR